MHLIKLLCFHGDSRGIRFGELCFFYFRLLCPPLAYRLPYIGCVCFHGDSRGTKQVTLLFFSIDRYSTGNTSNPLFTGTSATLSPHIEQLDEQPPHLKSHWFSRVGESKCGIISPSILTFSPTLRQAPFSLLAIFAHDRKNPHR